MTAQKPDIYFYCEEEYRYVASKPLFDFTPRVFGLEPESVSTACWRGFWCTYEVSDKGFMLKELYVHTKDNTYPEIHNATLSDIEYVACTAFKMVDGKLVEFPYKTEKYHGHRRYKDFSFPIDYTGNLLIGKEFLNHYYLHIGYQNFYTYKKLIEIVVTDGKVVKMIDRSDIARLVRDKIDATVEDLDYDTDIRTIIKQVIDENSISGIWWLDRYSR